MFTGEVYVSIYIGCPNNVNKSLFIMQQVFLFLLKPDFCPEGYQK